MGFSLLPQNTRELWKEWELRLLVLLSLFLQLTLATQGFRRKSIYRYWIRVVVWTTYLSADSIATLTLGVLSNRLANIKETKGMIDSKSQITAFWAPFLLLHLGGPDTITAYALEDNELWLRQLARLCVQVGLACYIYFMALSGSTLSIFAAGMILVGFIKYSERTLCLYLASEGRLRDSMLSLPDFGPVYPRIMEQYTLKKQEGYQVGIDEVLEVLAPEDLSVSSDQASDKENATTLVKAYELFKIFKLLFVGLVLNAGDLEASKRMFRNPYAMNSVTAFKIVEIELGFMYDLLYTKALLLNRAWGIIRWVINLSVPCAVLVFFSLQDRKDYAKVDICITFLLISVAILLEIYSVLLAISSDWVDHWRLQRPRRATISSVVAFLRFCPKQRWSNSVAQFSLLGLSIRKRNRIFCKCLRLTKLDEKMEKNFCINYKDFENNIKEWILDHMRDTVKYLQQERLSLKQEAIEVLRRSNNDHLNWSVRDMEFDQSILIWHIATELCHYKDLNESQKKGPRDIKYFKMSKLVSQYMLYLLVFHPSMLPTGIGLLQYDNTLVDAQKFFEDKIAVLSKKKASIISLGNMKWAQKLFKKEKHSHTDDESSRKVHKSTESGRLCQLCHLLLQVGTELPARKISGGKSRSVLFDACLLASQLNDIERNYNDSSNFSRKWALISKVWAKLLIYAACQSKGSEHSKSLSRGGELISQVWLLMAHLGIAEPVQTSEAQYITKLIAN